MLRVLWIAYQPLKKIANQISGQDSGETGGWLDGGAERIISHSEIELSYCFPYLDLVEGKVEGIHYYTIHKIPELHFRDVKKYRQKDFERFRYIIEQAKPDVIHIYGTETVFQRQFVQMAYELGKGDITVSWIQGLVSRYAMCYTDGLSYKQIRRKTMWECLRGTNVGGIQKRLALNGLGEIRAIKQLNNVFVRTDWDSACCKAINPCINLYRCNETLRPVFYKDKLWDIEKIEKHSIFLSQCGTPIKGLHKMLQALVTILREYPDTVIYTTGVDLFRDQSIVERVREGSYQKFLRESILKYGLKDHIKFLGTLNAEQMRNRYVKSHLFVSASSIENSPNSVGEAMILGVPSVVSDVGGVSSIMTHQEEGLLYPYHEDAVLAEYVCKIFANDKLAQKLSQQARKRALQTHDREANYRNLLNAYKNMTEK